MPEATGPKMKTEHVRVVIETARFRVVGTVHPPALSYRSRLSDLLNQKEVAFLSVTDVTVYNPGDHKTALYTTPYLAINLDSIDMVQPLDEPGTP